MLLVLNPLVLAVSALAGVGLCRAMNWNLHGRELAMAGGICFVATEAAAVALLLGRDLMLPAQAALLATVLHLMISTMATGTVMLLVHPPASFLFWLFPFYTMTLIAVCAACIRYVRATTPPPAVTTK